MSTLHLLQTLTVKRRTGKHNLRAAAGKYKLKTKAVKYIFGAGTVKEELSVRLENTNTQGLKTFGIVLNILFL